MINKNEEIEVLNYYDYPKYLVSQSDELGYKIEGQVSGEAGVMSIPFGDIKFINGKSECFRNGTLVFEEERQEEVYKELKINPEKDKNYFTRKQIEDIILDPDDEKITKIVNITSRDTIDNFRRILVKLTNDNEYDISNRIREYIDAREYEIKHGKVASSLPVPKRKIYKPVEEEIETAIVPEEKVEAKETKTANKKSTTK